MTMQDIISSSITDPGLWGSRIRIFWGTWHKSPLAMPVKGGGLEVVGALLSVEVIRLGSLLVECHHRGQTCKLLDAVTAPSRAGPGPAASRSGHIRPVPVALPNTSNLLQLAPRSLRCSSGASSRLRVHTFPLPSSSSLLPNRTWVRLEEFGGALCVYLWRG